MFYLRGAGAGFANLAGSIATFERTSFNWNTDRPLNQLTVQWNGIFTPETSR
jgi:hypothetical protein